MGLGVGGGCGIGLGLGWGAGLGWGSKYINQHFVFEETNRKRLTDDFSRVSVSGAQPLGRTFRFIMSQADAPRLFHVFLSNLAPTHTRLSDCYFAQYLYIFA